MSQLISVILVVSNEQHYTILSELNFTLEVGLTLLLNIDVVSRAKVEVIVSLLNLDSGSLVGGTNGNLAAPDRSIDNSSRVGTNLQ